MKINITKSDILNAMEYQVSSNEDLFTETLSDKELETTAKILANNDHLNTIVNEAIYETVWDLLMDINGHND